MYRIYTDGATSKNGMTGAIGGWAFLVLKDNEIIGSGAQIVQPATNNICELLAIIKGCNFVFNSLSSLDNVEVYSDSAYCINCVKERWYEKWLKNNWINSNKEPVKNRELWEQLIPFFRDIRFKWIKVKGHNGDKYNEIVDKMAVNARLGETINEDFYSKWLTD